MRKRNYSHAAKKSPAQLQREIDEALSRTSTEPPLATWRSSADIRASMKKGDRLDNFGQIWRVLRVGRNKIMAARELPDLRDPEKVVLVDQRDFHPRDLAHMRKLGTASAVSARSAPKRAHATKHRSTEHPSGVEWSDLAPTGIRVQTHSGDMPLEDATPAEIRRDMNRRLAGYRALTHVPARRKKWALSVYELAQAKPWVMDQVPHDIWGLVLADIGRGR